jgi:hypothetical protein
MPDARNVGEADALRVHRKADAACPPGFELVSVPVRMSAGTTTLTATATYHPRATRDIEAPDARSLRAAVPDVWRLLYVV